jgi:hypothetical protein
MAKGQVGHKKQEAKADTAERPTEKRALAEALRHLGPDASHSALARFVQEQFGMKLAFYMLVPRAGVARKPAVPPAPRKRSA